MQRPGHLARACAGIPGGLLVLLDLLVLPVVAVNCRPTWTARDVQAPASDLRETKVVGSIPSVGATASDVCHQISRRGEGGES